MGQTKQNGERVTDSSSPPPPPPSKSRSVRPASSPRRPPPHRRRCFRPFPPAPRQAATPRLAARRDAGPRRRVPSQGPLLVLPPPARLRGRGCIRGRRWRPPATADPEGPLARHCLRGAHDPGEGGGRCRLRHGQGGRRRARAH
jgi:hypothetical protein